MSDTPSQPAEPEAAAPPEAPPLPWAEVQPEHFRLLRLAPLQTDRHTGGRPLRFVQFGHAERHSKDISLLRLNIALPGQRVRSEQNHLDVWADHVTHRVRISPERGMQIEPLNRGIGRFVLARAVQWAQKRWSHYRIDATELASKDALSEDSRLRRDHFLRIHGFDVVYADAQFLKARIEDVKVGELLDSWNAEKLQFLEILDAAQMLQQAEQNLQEQDVKLRDKEEKLSKYQREETGLRFTITCLVAFTVFQAGLLIWIATHR
ncbi:hypothetical protein [Pseudomonas deceptionensis]|uniref:Uncharacterized protein n=1 Tax=Pseudomonas deceptionensis TaxID=882211 RepID=A0A0J6J5J7_PSEDM|nr:hypothetical protein [Pseudomonas deceptionensis]KMM79127.1 hypothetical protein TR67_15420 [Pseudomonas deceptionensis]SEF04649.1 hypothetical protein SAMN04489800_3926 [Pseudomonas deceptionensis]